MPLSDAWVDFVAGWCSGGVAVLACQPVDTVLTRWQAGLVMIPTTTTTTATTTATTTSSLSLWQNATQQLRVTALWRGASPMIGAVPLQNALLMGGYGLGQAYGQGYYNDENDNNNSDAPKYRQMAIFAGGCTGGILQSFLMSPVEGIKVAQQCAGQSFKAALVQGRAWQRGLGATLLRDGIPHGVWFVAYEECKDGLEQPELLGTDRPVMVPLLAGAGAATAAWAVGYPADLIKTRIQASAHNLTIMETVAILRAEAGGSWWALYRGFGLKLVRSVPASMIGFCVYEAVKRYVLQAI